MSWEFYAVTAAVLIGVVLAEAEDKGRWTWICSFLLVMAVLNALAAVGRAL